MGTVYAAYDRSTETKVALKLLHQQHPDSLELFKREFRNFQGIEHRNLISLGELREDSGNWFFTMELLTGKNFDDFVRAGAHALDAEIQRSSTFLARGVTMPANLFSGMRRVSMTNLPSSNRRKFHEERLRDALAQLACGLGVLHAAHKVHADIKPTNIVIEPDGRLVILDFGIAIDIDDHDRLRADRVLGSVYYMAPEQVVPSATGPASDCYAVGVLLYEALTGVRPFVGGDPRELLERKSTREPKSPSSLAVSIPSDLERLCLDLLARNPAKRPTAAEILRRLGAWDLLDQLNTEATEPMGEEVFVGRKQLLVDLLEASKPPIQGRVIVISGPSGIGKTALLERYRLRLSDTLLLSGRCHERESVPFKGIDSVIQALLNHVQELSPKELEEVIPAELAEVANIFPGFKRLFDIGDVDQGASPYDLRQEAFNQLRMLFTRLARRTPIAITIDDMQWADTDTWSIIGHLMRNPHPPPMLMILSMRAYELPEREETSQLGDIEVMELEPLDPDESLALATYLLGGIGRDERGLAEEIARESEGRPQFIHEIIRYAGERLDLEVDSGLLEVALLARIDQLSVDAQKLLRMLATATVPLTHTTMSSAIGIEFNHYLRLVNESRAVHLVQTSGVEPDDTIELDHERVREAVLGALEDGLAHDIHGQLARAMQRTGVAAKQPEIVAHHLMASGEQERASKYWLEAAEQAMSALAFDSAATLYRSALACGSYPEDEQQRILLRLADALGDSGQGQEAGEALLQVAGTTEDPALRLRCLYRGSEQLLMSGDIKRGRDVLDRVLMAIDVRLPRTRLGTVWSLLARRMWLRIRGLRWRERAAEDLPAAALLRVDIHCSSGRALGLTEPVAAAAVHCRALLHALRLGEPLRVGWCLAFEATFGAVSRGSSNRRALDLLGRAEAIAERLDAQPLRAWVMVNRGLLSYFNARYREAYEILTESEHRFEGLPGQQWERSSTQTMRLLTLRNLGWFRELYAVRKRYLRVAVDRGDLYTEALLRRTSTLVWLARDDLENARRQLELAIWRAPDGDMQLQDWYEIRSHAEIALYQRDDAGALESALAEVETVEASSLMHVRAVCSEVRFMHARLLLALGGNKRRAIARFARQLARGCSLQGQIFGAFLEAALAVAGDDKARACLQLDRVESLAVSAGADWMRHGARYWKGRLQDDQAGEQQLQTSLGWMKNQGVAAPERLAGMLIPLQS